jgi:hypothetical protein
MFGFLLKKPGFAVRLGKRSGGIGGYSDASCGLAAFT